MLIVIDEQQDVRPYTDKANNFIGLKLLSVFSIGCIGSAQMFLPVFYKKVLELGNDKIGFMFSITPLVSLIAMPYWTSLVDKTGEYKKVMIRNMLVALGCIWSIAFVPYVSEQDWIRILLTSMGCFGYAFFGYPVIAALVDAVTLRVLAERKDLYGRQKIGVPIGFASSVFLTGFLIEKFGSPYALFVVFGAFALLFIMTIACIDMQPPEYEPLDENTDYGATTPPQPFVAQVKDDDDDSECEINDENQTVSIWYLLQTPESVQFFTFVILLGSTFSVIQAFLYLFFEHDVEGGTASMLGLFGPLGSSTEIVCFFFSKQANFPFYRT
ncbi:major facilitator superfamily domain-containing protein [Choanephora cucurbitarum]|nr:major facilitator superfamily domain-containing protein [Choanephora cucurbitarum]